MDSCFIYNKWAIHLRLYTEFDFSIWLKILRICAYFFCLFNCYLISKFFISKLTSLFVFASFFR